MNIEKKREKKKKPIMGRKKTKRDNEFIYHKQK